MLYEPLQYTGRNFEEKKKKEGIFITNKIKFKFKIEYKNLLIFRIYRMKPTHISISIIREGLIISEIMVNTRLECINNMHSRDYMGDFLFFLFFYWISDYIGDYVVDNEGDYIEDEDREKCARVVDLVF